MSILSLGRLLELLEKRRKRQGVGGGGHDTTRYNLGSTKEDTRRIGMTFRANFRRRERLLSTPLKENLCKTPNLLTVCINAANELSKLPLSSLKGCLIIIPSFILW